MNTMRLLLLLTLLLASPIIFAQSELSQNDEASPDTGVLEDNDPDNFQATEDDSEPQNFEATEDDSEPENFEATEGDSEPQNFEATEGDSEPENFEAKDSN